MEISNKPNIFDRKSIPCPKGINSAYDPFILRQKWETLIDPMEFSITYETGNFVKFYSPNLHLTKLYISKHDYAAIAEFFMFFQEKIYHNINGFQGLDNIKFIVGEF